MAKISSFGTVAPQPQVRPLSPVSTIVRRFCTPSYLALAFHISRDSLHSYGVVSEKPRFGHLPQIFPCTVQEILCVGSKNRRPLSPCKVWGDRTTLAGCMCENVVFVCFLFVTLRVWRAVPSSGIYFEQLCVTHYGSILIPFSPFLRTDCPFRNTRQFLFTLLGGATIFAKLQLSKFVQVVQKRLGTNKFVRTKSHRGSKFS